MASIIIPRRFTSQPQGPVEVAWDNPITQGLIDLKTPRSSLDGSTKLTAATIGVGDLGVSIDFNGASSYVDTSFGTLESSVTLGFIGSTTNISNYQALVANSQNGTCGFWVNNHAGLHFRQAEGVGGLNSPDNIVLSGVTFHGTAVLSSSGRRVYKNGALTASDTDTTAPATLLSNFYLGKTGVEGNQNYLYGKCYLYYRYARALLASEILELYSNPWQLFRAKPRILYFTTAGGGAFIATTSLNAAIQQARNATASVNGAIQSTNTASTSVNTAIQRSNTASASVNGAIQKSSTSSASVNAAIQQAFTASANLDSAIQSSHTASASINGYIQAGSAVSANLNAAIQQARSAVTSLDAGISVAHTASASVNGTISQSHVATTSLNGAVLQSRTATAALSAALLLARSATVDLNGYVLANTQVSCYLNAAIKATHIASASLNCYIGTASVPEPISRRTLSAAPRVTTITAAPRQYRITA